MEGFTFSPLNSGILSKAHTLIFIFFKDLFLAFLPLLIVFSEDRQEMGGERRGETCSKGRHERDSNTRHTVRLEPMCYAPGPLGQRAPRII